MKININKEKMKDLIKRGAIIVTFGTIIGTTAAACVNGREASVIETTTDIEDETTNNIEIETTTDNKVENETTNNTINKEEVKQPEQEKEEIITEMNVETFNKLVDEVEKANKEAGFNLKRENLELVYYMNNIDLATPELVEKIESYYKYVEKDMMSVYIDTITSYNNDKVDYYNGKDDKYADISLLFVDKLDKETVKYIDTKSDDLYTNIKGQRRNELNVEKFYDMIRKTMAKNEELGIKLSRDEVAIIIYENNYKQATEVVRKLVEFIKLEEGQTLESVANNVLNIYKAHNKRSKNDFDLNYLEFESYLMGSLVDEYESYMRENGTINDYTKEQLTVGGMFTAKLRVDDILSYYATTSYATLHQTSIDAISEANLKDPISDMYNKLGSKAQLVNCEGQKTLSLTNK